MIKFSRSQKKNFFFEERKFFFAKNGFGGLREKHFFATLKIHYYILVGQLLVKSADLR